MTRIDYLDPDDTETAHFMPEHSDVDTGHIQVVAVAPLKHRETSIIFLQLDTTPVMIHVVFTEEETDMMIAALQENKKRWETGKVI